MPVLPTLVSVDSDHLYYLMQTFSSGGELPTFGGNYVIPWGDLQTAGTALTPGPGIVNNAFRQVIWADTNGFGTIPPNAGLTTAQARALVLLDYQVNIGGTALARATTTIQPRSGLSQWTVDAIDMGVSVTATNDGATSLCYLRIDLIFSAWR